ncbi:MAG TPA: Flp pilus assembly protein CpaB [Polyangia bacterium]|jgi:pilus assembly protein CpaB
MATTTSDWNDGVKGLRRAAGLGSRRSGLRAAAFLVVAVTAGLAAAALVTRYVDGRTRRNVVPTSKVAVAAQELELATTLRPEHITMIDWPQSSRPPGAQHDAKALVGRVILTKVAHGEPILAGKLADTDAGHGLAAVIPPDMRAAAVRVDDVVGVAGFIHPGDRVDVIVTMKPRENGTEVETASKVILQNVKVLAVGKEMESRDSARQKPIPVTVATLLVSPEDSEKVALAATKGKLLLTLRSGIDTRQVETRGIVGQVLLAGIDATPEAKPAPVAPAAPAAPASSGRGGARHAKVAVAKAEPSPKPGAEIVEVIRGDRFEQRKFDKKGD